MQTKKFIIELILAIDYKILDKFYYQNKKDEKLKKYQEFNFWTEKKNMESLLKQMMETKIEWSSIDYK